MIKKETKASKAGPFIYQINVTLEDSEPPIWRRIQIASNISLRKLHKILQAAMGWETRHLHEFIVGREHFGEPDPEYEFEMQDDRKTRLDQAAPRHRDRFVYVYDFGDGWRHELTVEKIELHKSDTVYPILVEGARACPPEDCGGIGGYTNFLEAIRDPDRPEHEESLAWIGGNFDPEAFDADEINRRLKRVK
jgi:Plasmid pRiA4b ORF-3-like protein